MASKNILIVDDDENNRRLLSAVMTSRGYHTLEAESGEQALEMLKGQTPDLIFMDCRMAGIDGAEACRVLKSQAATAKIPVFIVTASAMKSDREKIMKESGCDMYFAKPINIKEVTQSVAKYLGRGPEA